MYKRKTSNLFLGLLFGALFFVLFKGIIHAGGYYAIYSALLFTPIYWTTAIGVFVFFYVKTITNGKPLVIKDAFHFSPLLIQVLFHGYWYVKPLSVKLAFYENEYFSGILFYEEWIAVALCATYTLLAFKTIQGFINNNAKALVKEQLKPLSWSKKLTLILLVYIGFWASYLAVDTFSSNFTLPYAAYYPLYILTIGFIIWIAMSVFLILEIVNQPTVISEKRKEVLDDTALKLTIEKELIPSIFDVNYGLLSTENLADKLEVTPKYLSEYFNMHFGVSYNEYIINQRMKKFEALIHQFDAHAGDVIKQLQYECGYLSKASFNRHVKAHFGDTPSNLVKLKEVSIL